MFPLGSPVSPQLAFDSQRPWPEEVPDDVVNIIKDNNNRNRMSKDNSTNGAVQRRGPPPDSKTPIARTKLPDELQKLVDNEESLIDQLYDGT